MSNHKVNGINRLLTARLAIGLVVLLLWAAWGQGAGAQGIQPTEPFATLIARWTRVLDSTENNLKEPNITAEQIKELRKTILAVQAEASSARAAADKRINDLKPLLDALGTTPGPDMPAEHESIIQKRQQYQNDLADYQARRTLSELMQARSQELLRKMDDLNNPQLTERLKERWPVPLLPSVALAGMADFWNLLHTVALSPFEWIQQTDITYWSSHWQLALWMLLGVAATWYLRVWLLRRYGRVSGVVDPSYARRLAAAVVEGVARGLVPASIFAVMLAQTGRVEAAFPGLFVEVYRAFWGQLIVYTVIVSLSRAALAPNQPAWQLLSFKPEQIRLINRRIIWLASIASLEGFLGLVIINSAQLQVSNALNSVGTTFFNILLGIGLLSLMRQWLWEDGSSDQLPEMTPTARPDQDEEPPDPRLFWRVFRRTVSIIVLISLGSALTGFGNLSNYLMWATQSTVMLAALVFILRALLNDLLTMGLAWDRLNIALGLSPANRSMLRFWLGIVLEAAIWLLAAFSLLFVWGVPVRELMDWSAKLLSGITVGSVTISLLDVGLAIVIFLVVLALSRVLQRVMVEKTLVHSRMSASARYSIGAAIRYLGVILAVVLAIAALGMNMSNIALVAGALSVGIGFGLQNIVNNFVSGMILLIERPIKVGDWVIVGTNEGLVKRINIRATELETFQMASVIIPNAEILSNALTNWTLSNHYGRIEVRVGVAYGTDAQKVQDILLQCAREHPLVIGWIAPFVVFQDFGPSRLEFELRCFTADVMQRVIIASELRFAIQRHFEAAGIEIPLPQQVMRWAGEAPPWRPVGGPPDKV